MKQEQPVYTIERIFLGKVKPEELIGHLVKEHSKNTELLMECNSDKTVKR